MQKYDLIVIGAGPAGIFTCLESIKIDPNMRILLIDQGKPIERRFCPISQWHECVKCKPFCNITSGFSGAGAFSDGKLTLYNPTDNDIYVGGNIHKYIGVDKTKEYTDYVDSIYLEYGADKHVEGLEFKDEVDQYKNKAKEVGLDLIALPIRHLGTEKAHALYQKMQQYLNEKVDILFETQVVELSIGESKINGVVLPNMETVESDRVVIAVGRKGANWLSNMCKRHDIKNRTGIVDIGIRYELPDSIMADVNRIMYEAKFVGYPEPFKDKVRTFCQNPSGFVSSEVYDNELNLVNGHSFKDRKSTNTNLAILCSHYFKDPFDEPILYGRNTAINANLLSDGNVLIQRLGDLLNGHRSYTKSIENNSVVPTLPIAVAGDISHALYFRTLTNILQFIKSMDKIIPGFADEDNLMYAPEIKFYSNEVIINKKFETSIQGLYSIGDAGGLTRGLMQASMSGVLAAKNIAGKEI